MRCTPTKKRTRTSTSCRLDLTGPAGTMGHMAITDAGRSRDMSARYDTERYAGAGGLNWWTADPTLQFQLRMHMPQRDYGWAAPHLERFGAFPGGPPAARPGLAAPHPPR